MKKTVSALFAFATAATITGQTFTGAGGAILDNGGQETFFNGGVSGLPAKIDSTFGLVEVTLNITHPEVSEMQVRLISPWGTKVDLTGVMLSTKGANYSATVLNNAANTSITLGNGPFTGTFRPVGYLGRFNTGKNPNGTWKLEVKDFVLGNAGTVTSWSLKFAQNPPKPVVFTSSNLPIVILNTNNQDISDNDLIATISTIDNGSGRNYLNGPRKYTGKCAVHERGSSSKMFEKKNIKVELRDNGGVADLEVPLLNMPPESDWVLTAFYNDKSLIRNPLTHYLFSQMGHYAPRFRYVELVLNDEYFGVYLLMEQPKRGSDRVNINKLEPYQNTYPAITGGYIVQINRRDDPGWESLYPGISSNPSSPTKFYYQYNYPKPENISGPQKAYIKAVLDSFETVMNGPNFADPKTGYRKFINDDSFIDFMIINEISKNVDAYKLSTYLYKHNVIDGGKINIGPTWDYDLAWYNSDFGNAFNELYWQFEQPNNDYAIPTWWVTFMKDPAFKDKLYCRYHTLRKYILSNDEIYEFIDTNVELLAEAQVRNFKQFPVLGAKLYGNPQTPQDQMTYAKEIQFLKDWVYKRGKWLDENIPGFCNDVSVKEHVSLGEKLVAYPNPFQDRINISYNLNDAREEVYISAFDITGARVYGPAAAPEGGGSQQVSVDTSTWPVGIYVVELKADGRRMHYKVVKSAKL